MTEFTKDYLLRMLITKVLSDKQVPELKFEPEFYDNYAKLIKKIQDRKSDLPALSYVQKTYGFDPAETEFTLTDILEQLNRTYFRERAVQIITKFKEDAKTEKRPEEILKTLSSEFNSVRAVLTNNFVCDITSDTDKVIEEFIKEMEGGNLISTGLEVLDKVVAPKVGDLMIVCGATGRGKTQVMLKMFRAAIDNGEPAIFFSLEMSLLEVTNRLIAMSGKYTYDDLKHHRISPEQYKAELELLNKTPAIIVTRANESLIDLGTVEKYIQEYDPRLVCIDYLTLLDGCDFNWSADVQPMAQLKRMGGVYKALMVVGAQADTASMGSDDIPDLENVRGNKGISHDSNIFLGVTSKRFINDETNTEEDVVFDMRLGVKKSRDGKCPHFSYRCTPNRGIWERSDDGIDF